jgi:hypothetical protein
MPVSKQHFLFFVICLCVQSQVLTPIGSCLGRCATCDPLILTKCKGQHSCEGGTFDKYGNGICLQNPTFETVSSELGERTDNSVKTTSNGWGDVNQSICEYTSIDGRKSIDVLGIFSQVSTI